MTTENYTDAWCRYWTDHFDGSRRLQLEHATSDPLGRWLVADAATLVEDEYGIDPAALRHHPDDVLAAARDGFEAFVAESDLDPHPDDRFGYEVLPIHLTTVRRLRSVDPGGVDPVEDGHTLVLLPDAAVIENPEISVEAAIVTFQCPRGHETSVRRPLFRRWQLETCPKSGCGAPVVVDDTRTRARRVSRFRVEADETRLRCVATGRYAAPTDARDQFLQADRLELTGVLRPVADDDGMVDPRLEVLHAEPV